MKKKSITHPHLIEHRKSIHSISVFFCTVVQHAQIPCKHQNPHGDGKCTVRHMKSLNHKKKFQAENRVTKVRYELAGN